MGGLPSTRWSTSLCGVEASIQCHTSRDGGGRSRGVLQRAWVYWGEQQPRFDWVAIVSL
jgi:hypothetical protein